MHFDAKLQAFRDVLRRVGLHAALGWLNAEVAYRYTGIWRFDGAMLRSVCFYDCINPRTTRGQDVPLGATFCGVVSGWGTKLEVFDSQATTGWS